MNSEQLAEKYSSFKNLEMFFFIYKWIQWLYQNFEHEKICESII